MYQVGNQCQLRIQAPIRPNRTAFFREKLNNDIVIHQDHEYPVIGHDNFLVSRISSCQRPVALAHALVALPS